MPNFWQIYIFILLTITSFFQKHNWKGVYKEKFYDETKIILRL